MSNQARVQDLEVFSRFRAALVKFAQAADQSLSNADSEIAKTHSWLENEQNMFWQGQLRKRAEAVSKARDAVRQKKLYLDSSGRTPSAAEEEKALARCLAAEEQAREKLQSVRKWLPRLEKAADVYRSGVARLGTDIAVEVPRAVALLDRLAVTLEAYLQIETPAGVPAASVWAAPNDATEKEERASVSRGGEKPMESEPLAVPDGPALMPATPPVPPAGSSTDPIPPEDADVADRQ